MEKYVIGDVIKILYIVFLRTKKKKKKTYNFVGLCINKKKNFYTLKNNIKGEEITIKFDFYSPTIVKIIVLNVYLRLMYRVARLKFLNKINRYFEDYKNKENVITSNFFSFKRDYFHSAYFKKKLKRTKKKLRKFKKKYSYTENWKSLKIHMSDKYDY